MKMFLVALQTGGLMENPGKQYDDYQIVYADNEKQAVSLYNTKNKCSFFYGECIGEIESGFVKVPIGNFI